MLPTGDIYGFQAREQSQGPIIQLLIELVIGQKLFRADEFLAFFPTGSAQFARFQSGQHAQDLFGIATDVQVMDAHVLDAAFGSMMKVPRVAMPLSSSKRRNRATTLGHVADQRVTQIA